MWCLGLCILLVAFFTQYSSNFVYTFLCIIVWTYSLAKVRLNKKIGSQMFFYFYQLWQFFHIGEYLYFVKYIFPMEYERQFVLQYSGLSLYMTFIFTDFPEIADDYCAKYSTVLKCCYKILSCAWYIFGRIIFNIYVAHFVPPK